MRTKREYLILLIILPAVTAACILLWYLGNLHFYDRMGSRIISSEDGKYDLSGIDFENTVIRISRNAEYILNALLTPEEFNARAFDIETGSPGGYGTAATTRVRLIFPDDNTYMLAWDSSDFTETLYINGELRGKVGQTGLTKESEEAGHAFWYFSVKPSGGMVEIVRQVSNFAHREGGSPAWIYVGSEENIRLYVSLKTDFEGIVAGVFLVLFFVHLTLYFILRSYRANLYFAVLCLTWALRTGITGTKILLGGVPFLSWESAFRIEYISIPAAAIFVTLFIKEVFPSVAQKWLIRAVVGVSSAFVLVYLFAETLYMSHALLYYYVFYIAVIIWLVVRFAIKVPSAFKRGEYREEHFASLFGLIVFFYAAVHDAFYHNDIYLFGLNMAVTDVGLLIFSFAQMTVMSLGTTREVTAAREAEQQLTMEKDALDRVNNLKTELMRTISHEMRTPLAIIRGFAELTAEGARKDGMSGELLENLDTIAAEAARMANMTEEMRQLALAKEYPKDRHGVDMETVIRQITGLYTVMLEQKGTILELRVESGVWRAGRERRAGRDRRVEIGTWRLERERRAGQDRRWGREKN